MKVKHVKYLFTAFICIFLLFGCGTLAVRRSHYPPEILEKIDRIVITNESTPNEFSDKVKELGIVKQQFNPLCSTAEIQFELREMAISYYGDVDAIIRVSESMVPGYQFPLREVRGVAIKFLLTSEEREKYNDLIKKNYKK